MSLLLLLLLFLLLLLLLLPLLLVCATSICLLSVVCCLLSVVCCLLSVVCCLLSVVCCLVVPCFHRQDPDHLISMKVNAARMKWLVAELRPTGVDGVFTTPTGHTVDLFLLKPSRTDMGGIDVKRTVQSTVESAVRAIADRVATEWSQLRSEFQRQVATQLQAEGTGHGLL